MPVTLISSARAATRRHGADDWLARHAAHDRLVVVAATPAAAHEILRHAARRHGAIFGWFRATLPRIAAEITATVMAEEEQATIGAVASEAVTARAIFALADQLPGYAPVLRTPGFARAVTRSLHELRAAGVVPGALGTVKPELEAIAEACEAELADAGLIDRPGLLRRAAARADDPATTHPLLGLPLLLYDVPVESRADAALVAALARRSTDVFATVPAGDARTRRLIVDALGVPVHDADTAPVADTALNRLQTHLFEREPPPRAPADDSVTVLSAPGESRECVEIARRILEETRAGIPFDEIAILLRSPAEYRAHLELALSRASIPVHFARGVVRPDPAGRAFAALLRCRAEHLSARRFAEYLSLGELPETPEHGATAPAAPWTPPDDETLPERIAEPEDVAPAVPETHAEDTIASVRVPRRWEALLVEAAVIGGLDRWRRRLDGLRNALELERDALLRDDPESPRAAGAQRALDDLDALRAFALPRLERLAALPDRATWGTWLDHLTALATETLRRPDRVLAVLGDLAPMGPVGPVSLDEVRHVLDVHLLELHAPRDPQRHGRVFVGPIDAARGLTFRVVFAPGFAERLFPRTIREDPILLDAVRADLDDTLATQTDRTAAERQALHATVGAASERLVLSFPRLDLDQSRPRVPSFYALECMRAAEGILPRFDELAGRAETVADAHIGWPAPRDPDDAIDEAEYDLALLRPLYDVPLADAAGRAHYLLNANHHLARALRFRSRRWRARWSAADGMVPDGPGADVARDALAAHGLGERSFSPTALQSFAACPYRFFLHTIMKLAPRDTVEPIDQLDPLQRGSLIHDVQFRLLEALGGSDGLPVRPATLAAARDRLDTILDDVAEAYRDELAPAIATVWRDGIEAIRADLREWLGRMAADDSGFVPWRFELAFGLPGHRQRDRHSVDAPVPLDCGLHLRGSIDLVERNADGALRITDHKTGKVSISNDAIIDGGAALQPVLYALAAEKLFPDHLVTGGRLSFCTTRGGFAERTVTLDDDARAAAQLVADAVRDALEHAFLPALPRVERRSFWANSACDWCDFRSVCGPREVARVNRKPGDPRLERLVKLRVQP